MATRAACSWRATASWSLRGWRTAIRDVTPHLPDPTAAKVSTIGLCYLYICNQGNVFSNLKRKKNFLGTIFFLRTGGLASVMACAVQGLSAMSEERNSVIRHLEKVQYV